MLFQKRTNEKVENKEEKQMSKETRATESKKEKLTFKDKLKNFIKNKKAVAMVMEYILTIECFTMLFLLTTPTDVKAATFTDESGITWAYTLSNNQATNVYKSGGTLTSTLTIPAYLNEYPVVSIGRNNSSYNILNSTANNTTITEIVLPETLTSIGNYAFKGCTGLTSVTIGSSVTSIGNYVFQNCTGITSIEIPNSVTSIGNYVFQNCIGLTSVTISSSVTNIGKNVFNGCTNLINIYIDENNNSFSSEGVILYNKDKTVLLECASEKTGEIVIPNSVTSIGEYAFYSYKGITKITMPGTASIGSNAFMGVTNVEEVILTGEGEMPDYQNSSSSQANYFHNTPWFQSINKIQKITIGKGITSIGNKAFSGCSSLKSIIIPNSVTSIGESAFYGCTGLTGIIIPSSVTSIGSSAFSGCTGITSIIIPNSVTSIGVGAFVSCTGLTSVTLGNGVTSIKENLFYGCTGLTSIKIPNSVTSIGKYAFYNCTGITSIEIPDSVTTIEGYAFSGCTRLTSIEIPASMTSIEFRAFYGFTGLTSIVIPSNVTSIGNDAFYNCTGLTSIEIPNSITSIGSNAFYNCTGLTSIEIPNSVTSIDSNAFYNCTGLTEIIIPNSVTSIHTSTFQNCTGIKKLTMPGTTNINTSVFSNMNNIEEIVLTGEGAIPDCSNGTYTMTPWYRSRNTIKSIKIGDKITSIGNYVFQGCTGLTSIVIPNNVTSIGLQAFYECTGLKNITIPITTTISYSAFYRVTNIEEIILTGEGVMPDYSNSGSNFTPWYFSMNTIKRITIGEEITSIGNYAFYQCTGLTEIEIPSSVTSIGNDAFYQCTGLTEIEIPSSVTSIGNDAFSQCSGLTSIEISSNITSIGDYAFYGCRGLTKIEIPNSVTNMGSGAFGGCTGLTSIIIGNNVTSIGERVFQGCTGVTSIIIPSSVTSIGERAFDRCTGVTEIEIPNSVTSIGRHAFYGCTGLTEIEMPNRVTNIGAAAFSCCTGLINIEVPNSVTSIESEVFYGCTSLTSVEIQNSVTSIGKHAFYNCSGLTMITMPGTASIEQYAFSGVTNVEEIILTGEGEMANYQTSNSTQPNYYQYTPWYQSRNKIQSITIGEGITSIGGYSFYQCTGLIRIEIPNSVTKIGERAFYNCSNLVGSIKISSTVTNIGRNAFSNCSKLTDIYVDNKQEDVNFEQYWDGESTLIYVHYKNHVHNINIEVEEGLHIEEIEGSFENDNIICQDEYKFRILDEKNNIVRNRPVLIEKSLKIEKRGSRKELPVEAKRLIVDENGIYTIENTDTTRNISLKVGLVNGVVDEWTDSNGITWSYTFENKQARGLKYVSGEIPDVFEVPDKINGFVVISLADEAFKGAEVKKVILPDSIINIGKEAFSGCITLEEVVLPVDLMFISDKAFSGCTSLGEVELPEKLEVIGNNAFQNCTNLSIDLELKSGMKTIGQNAFENCSSLTGELVLPSGIVQIASGAFTNCSGITGIRISKYIGEENIDELVIKFKQGVSLSTITEEIRNYTQTGIEKEIMAERDGANIINYILDENGKTIVVVRKTITIGGQSFSGCTSLNKIYLPEGTKKINYVSGLGFNNGLDIYVDMNNGEVTEDISSSTLSRVNVHYKGDKHIVEAKGKALNEGYSIQTIEGNLDSEGQIACESTYKFKVLDSNQTPVTEVQVRTKKTAQNISDAIELTANEDGIYTITVKADIEIIVGAGNGDKFTSEVEGITWGYTYEDGKATNVYYASGTLEETLTIPSYLDELPVVSIGANNGSNNILNSTSSNSTIKEVILPETLITIGDCAVRRFNGITNITIPNSVQKIGNDAFSECSGLTTIVIPEGVKRIESSAFSSCSGLTGSIEIPSSVTYIGNYAFSAGSKLTDIYIYNNEENLKKEGNIGGSANVHFLNHKHSIIINNDPREKVIFEEVEGNLVDGQILCKSKYSFRLLDGEGNVVKDKIVKIQIPTITIMPWGETRIELTTQDLSPDEEGIYTIESVIRDYYIYTGAVNGETKTFEDENGITWQYTYENEKARALKYVSGDLSEIENLEIPDKVDGLIVTTIADEALKGQTSIKNVILPDSITNIGQSSFEGCTNLETVVLPKELELISNKAFKGCKNLSRVELPDNLQGIGDEGFSGCSSLTMNLNLKNGLQVIGQESFKDCICLTGELILPETLFKIGTGAFSGCTGITRVIIMPYTGEDRVDISNIGYNNISMNITEEASSKNFLVNTTAISYGNLVIKDENGQNVNVVDEYGVPVRAYVRTVQIGQNAFSGCTSLEEMEIQVKVDEIDGQIITNCPNLKDVYIACKSTEMEELQVPEGVTVHYLDTLQEVEVDAIEGVSIEVISGADEEGKAYCQSDYKFKVNIAKGASYKGVVVKVGNKGEEKEVIKPDEDGVYTILRVLKDQEIEIIEGRTVEIKYVDNSGKEIAKSKIIAGLEGESYTTQSKEIQYYKWNGAIPENAEGVYTEEDIIVIYVYDNLPSGIITVKYIDKDGKEISEKETVQGYQGDTYEILRKNIKGYKAYGVTPENAKGMFTEEDVEVIFVYEAIEEDIVVKYVDEEGNYIARDKTVYDKEEIEAKDIDGYKNTGKEKDGKEITYTYEDTRNRSSKWTTEQTLLVIAGIIIALTVVFIIIARKEKKN